MGAALVLDTRAPDAVQRLATLAQGNLVGAIDLVGMPATFMTAYPALRKGGRYILCGLFGGEVTVALPPIAQRAVSITGSYVGDLAELKAVVALAKKKKLKPMPVETRAASEVNRTLDELKAGHILGRVVLDFETAPESAGT
jgi:D-arabinose 1-dehydrogenase-like Zn-dependent alcohol dehydrogenase